MTWQEVTKKSPEDNRKLLSRRQFIQAGILSVFLGFIGKSARAEESAMLSVAQSDLVAVSPEIQARVAELSEIPDEINVITQKRDALELLYQLFENGELSPYKKTIGWIDMSQINPHHPAFTNLELTATSIGSGELHATEALYFAAQLGHGEAGLSQKEWTKIHFIDTFESPEAQQSTTQAMLAYAKQIESLVDDGVSVIGSMPTWTEYNLSQGENYLENPGVKAIQKAFEYAQTKNVFIVLPAGNAGVNLAEVSSKRILHELVRSTNNHKPFSNVLVMGGVTTELERATWYTDTDEAKGSNYGAGYIDFVTVINRLVPYLDDSYGYISGTTFAVGELVSLIQAVQSILSKNKTSKTPSFNDVNRCLFSTSKDIRNGDVKKTAEFGNGVPQMKNCLLAALLLKEQQENTRK